MRRLLPLALSLCLAPAAVALLGCHHHHTTVLRAPVHHPGPPPHAPAHGYRAKHHHGGSTVELVFDGDLGVYVVVGLEQHYFLDDTYYRLQGGDWQVSFGLDGPWKAASPRALPPGLRKKAAHGHKRGGPPAKHPRH